MLVLGHPGAGKSVLMRAIAARLRDTGLCPIRVDLRHVPADGSILVQIDAALRDALHRQVTWGDLVDGAVGAVPVVLFDGFDELLQSSAVSRSDYLEMIQDFQRAEAAKGTPMIAIVTSRTVVAHRARIPAGSMVLRIEPFDLERVDRWRAAWRSCNADLFARAPELELTSEQAERLLGLTEQPLLLLMLALYVGEGNPMPQVTPEIEAVADSGLYERLLRAFAHREVTKESASADAGELEQLVDRELEQLSVAALSMFNRAAQYVTEADLNEDLIALTLATPGAGSSSGRRMTPAQLIVGRFFFVHVARARFDTGDGHLRTYEFLHATFGEFLVARIAVGQLRTVAARMVADRRAPSAMRPPTDDSLAVALLSFQNLAQRRQVIIFVEQILAALDDSARAELGAAILELFGSALNGPALGPFARYEPLPVGLTERIANYTANLVIMLVCGGRDLHLHELFPDASVPAAEWTRTARFWQSRMDAEAWMSVIDVLAFDPSRAVIRMRPAGAADGATAAGDSLIGLYSSNLLIRDPHLTEILTSVAPLARRGVELFQPRTPVGSASPARVLLDLLPLAESGSNRSRAKAMFRTAIHLGVALPTESRDAYLATVMQLLAHQDEFLAPDVLLEVAEIAVRAIQACPKAGTATVDHLLVCLTGIIRSAPQLARRCRASALRLLQIPRLTESPDRHHSLRIAVTAHQLLRQVDVPPMWSENTLMHYARDYVWTSNDGPLAARLFQVGRELQLADWQERVGRAVAERMPVDVLQWVPDRDLVHVGASRDHAIPAPQPDADK